MKCCEDVINKGDDNEDNFKEHKYKEQYHKEDNQMYPDYGRVKKNVFLSTFCG